MSNNEITYISNLTFNNLLLLRKLNLAQNVITTIDTNSFQGKARTISAINLSANKLTQADVSNGIFNNTFCEINLDSNMITKFTNRAGFKVDHKSKYGNGGHITFHNSSLTQFLNFTDLGFELSDLYKHFYIAIEMKGADVGCDCVLFQLLERSLSFNIYNGIIFPSLNPAKIFQFISQ